MTDHVLKQLGGPNPPAVEPEVMEKLRAYHWPGNVRQLRNCLERAVLLANNGRITVNELPPEVGGRTPGASSLGSVPGIVDGNGAAAVTPTALRDVEKQQIISALEQTGWHRGKTAALLGISPSTLYRRLRDYNLEGKLR
jgi:transcriptional regulator of acetoin/glycerol metabolism